MEWLLIGGIIFVALAGFGYCYRQVNEPKFAIILRLGLVSRVKKGWFFILPFLHSIIEDTSEDRPPETVEETVYTKDQVHMKITGTVIWKIDLSDMTHIVEKMRRFLSVKKQLVALIRTRLKDQYSNELKQYTYDELFEDNNEETIRKNLREYILKDGGETKTLLGQYGISITQFSIDDIEPNDPAVVAAAQEIKKRQLEVKVATAAAEITQKNAVAEALAIETKAKAEASRRRQILEAEAAGAEAREQVRTKHYIERNKAGIHDLANAAADFGTSLGAAIRGRGSKPEDKE